MARCHMESTKLPKNIRQIGEKDQLYRIYIEDYVYTFIKRLMNSKDLTAKAGMLLGKYTNIEDSHCYFIYGAVTVNGLWSELGELQFSETIWEEVQESQQKYFPDTEICGWFLRGSEEYSPDLILLKQMHRRLFHKESLLYVSKDSESGILVGGIEPPTDVKGYYIYYEKNPQMQEYMSSQTPDKKVENDVRDEAAHSFRQVMQEKRVHIERQHQIFWRRAIFAAAVVLFIIGMRIWISSNWENPGKENAVEAGASQSQTETVPESSETAASSISVNLPSTLPTASESTAEQAMLQTPGGDEAVGSVAAAPSGKYVIKPGDTLISICVNKYGTTQMLTKLCELNHISNANEIFVGQEIDLP